MLSNKECICLGKASCESQSQGFNSENRYLVHGDSYYILGLESESLSEVNDVWIGETLRIRDLGHGI